MKEPQVLRKLQFHLLCYPICKAQVFCVFNVKANNELKLVVILKWNWHRFWWYSPVYKWANLRYIRKYWEIFFLPFGNIGSVKSSQYCKLERNRWFPQNVTNAERRDIAETWLMLIFFANFYLLFTLVLMERLNVLIRPNWHLVSKRNYNLLLTSARNGLLILTSTKWKRSLLTFSTLHY